MTFSQIQVELTWNASTDNVGVEGYNIWIDGVQTYTTPDTVYVFELTTGTYSLTVSAFDAAGNESDQSLPLVITIDDTIPPTIPENLKYEILEEDV